MKKIIVLIKEWLEAVAIALFLILFFRTFIFEAFTVPTTSMEKTLLSGDFVLVNKINYGARAPITPLSLPFTHQFNPFLANWKSYLDWIELPYYRTPGLGQIKHNDVLVFNYPLDTDHPIDHKTHFIKRCVGLPGDTFELYQGNIIINSDSISSSENCQYNFHIKSDDALLTKDLFDSLGIKEGGKISNQGDYRIAITSATAKDLQQINFLHDVIPYFEKKGDFEEYIFPFHENFKWNIDNIGPLVIPKKGQKVLLNEQNLPLYDKIIKFYEKRNLEFEGDTILLDGKPVSEYTFEMNYYFVMGDNRHFSSDSRFWGFLPESHIIGKASFILFSINKEASLLKRIRWQRILKSIE